MDDLLLDFLTESTENLSRLDREIVALEKTPGDLVLLGSIFRTIHTIKGTCGFLDLQRLESVAHAAENVLGLLRDGSLAVTPDIISDVLAAVDVIREILDGLERDQIEPAGDDAELIAKLDRWLGPAGADDGADDEIIEFPVMPIVRMAADESAVETASPAAEAADAVPAASASAGAEAGASAENDELAAKAAPRAGRPGKGSGAKKKTKRAAAAGPTSPKTGVAAEPASAGAAAAAAAGVAGAASAAAVDAGDRDARAGGGVAESSLRVSVEVLDQLMNMAGEMVLTRNQLLQLALNDDHSPFRVPLQHLNRVTSELQEVVMKARMQPIGNAWGKLPRLVRDLCQASGKKIDLQMRGAETELDRQILQAIQDPLTHMVRNSADHGVEAPAARQAAGKPETGTIVLEAFHEGGHIIIEVRDDGKGLDAEAIRRKAVERGLVSAEAAAALADHQVFRFIFEAGFSTAEKVTNVSGRGVGMDVVRSNVEQIGGTVELSSTLGQGTTLRIKLPLTLAILSALIVGAGAQRFAIPQIGVVELVRISDENRTKLQTMNGARFYRLRDTLLPLTRLADVMQLPAGADDGFIVICQVGTHRFGLMVDAIFDTHEVVVKPIGRMVKNVPYYSGTTLLGDGSVIMILDVPSFAAQTGAGEQEALAAADAAQAAETATRKVSVVVFDSGGGVLQAVPLRRVSRLEKIGAQQIEAADGRWLVQYRGSLLPLVPATPQMDLRALDPRPVIVFTDGAHALGLGVENILDIVEDELNIQMESSAPGILGTAVIAGRSTEVVNIDYLFRRSQDTAAGAEALAEGELTGDASELRRLLSRLDRNTLLRALEAALAEDEAAAEEEEACV
jgi:two-component system, chemotaxis family, sensor kinase CheA